DVPLLSILCGWRPRRRSAEAVRHPDDAQRVEACHRGGLQPEVLERQAQPGAHRAARNLELRKDAAAGASSERTPDVGERGDQATGVAVRAPTGVAVGGTTATNRSRVPGSRPAATILASCWMSYSLSSAPSLSYGTKVGRSLRRLLRGPKRHPRASRSPIQRLCSMAPATSGLRSAALSSSTNRSTAAREYFWMTRSRASHCSSSSRRSM